MERRGHTRILLKFENAGMPGAAHALAPNLSAEEL